LSSSSEDAEPILIERLFILLFHLVLLILLFER